MQMGMVGLGRMGAGMVRRLMHGGHTCVVDDTNADAVAQLANEGAVGVSSVESLISNLTIPRIVWMMLPVAVVEVTVGELSEQLEPGDTIVDGGNSYYVDDIRRADMLKPRGIHCIDVGTNQFGGHVEKVGSAEPAAIGRPHD